MTGSALATTGTSGLLPGLGDGHFLAERYFHSRRRLRCGGLAKFIQDGFTLAFQSPKLTWAV